MASSTDPGDRDPLVRAATAVIGGPLGRYADRSPLPWQLVSALLSMGAALTLALGVLQKSFCLQRGWGVPDVFWRACYIDMPYLFANTQLVTGDPPYPAQGDGLAQPLGTGLALWLTSMAVPGGADAATRQQLYVGVWTVVLTLALIALVVITARTVSRTPWSAAHVAFSPLIVTVALVSPDLLGVTLASAGLWLWSRSRPTAAGVVLGLAILTRTYPVLFLLVLGMLALRAGRIRHWAVAAGSALLTWGSLTLLAGVLSNWSVVRPYQAWVQAGSDYGSIWYLVKSAGLDLSVGALTVVAVLGWILAGIAGATMSLVARHRPTVAEVSLVVVAVVLMTGKSFPVQSSLWLLPLVALAGLRWRDHLIWAACEAAYFVGVWTYLGGLSDPAKGLPLPWYGVFTVVRFIGIGYLAVVVWRRAMHRPPAPTDETDPVTGEPVTGEPEEDEVAGPLAGRHDAILVELT